jgi:primary-amine oxidase
MYELSLREAVTFYAGSEPFASQATFYDSESGFGTSTQSLVRGYDCLSYATYLNATILDKTGVKT